MGWSSKQQIQAIQNDQPVFLRESQGVSQKFPPPKKKERFQQLQQVSHWFLDIFSGKKFLPQVRKCSIRWPKP